MDKITMSLAEKVSWRHETGSFRLPHKTHAEVESITHAHLTGHCSLLNVENKNVHSDSEKCNEYRPYGKRRRLVVEDGNLSGEKAVHVEVKSSQEDKANPSSILGQNCHFLSQLNMKPVWRGSFSICNGNIGTVEGLVAHVSSKACPKVSAVARSMPASLCGELLHRNDLWPKGFDKSPPTDCDIALYFFPENKRDKKLYDSLLDELIDQKYALKAVVGRAELLVFTSRELPVEHSRFDKEHYLWGLFTKKKASPPYQADDHLHQKYVSTKCTEHLVSATDMGAGGESNLKKASDTCSPMSPLSSGGERQGMEMMKNNGPTPVQLKTKSMITHFRNTKSIEYNINPSMYLKKKVVSETGSGVGAPKQDAKKNLDPSDSMIQVENEVEQSPEERLVNGVFTVVEANWTIAEETTENTATAGAIHHEADIIKKSVTVEREPKDIAEKESDKDNPGDISVDAVALQAQLVIESTDTITNRSTEIVSSKDAIHHEDNVTKRSVTAEKETEDVDEMLMDIHTPESFVGNTDFTSDRLDEVSAPVDTNYHEKDITIRSVTMEKGPDGVSEKESPFPERISVNSGVREMFSGNINTISNTVGAILYKDIGTTMDKASMNKDVELDQSDPLIVVQKEFEQPSIGLVNEGLAEMQICRTIADVSTEHCALSSTNYHEKDETSVPVEKDHEGINKRGSDRDFPWNIAINAGPMQDGLSIRNTDAISNSIAAIPPQEINQAIDEASMNNVDQQVPVMLSIERPEQTAMNVFQSLLLGNQTNAAEHYQLGNRDIHSIPLHNLRCSEGLVGEGPQAGMVESAPETTVPSDVSSSLASARDVQETTNVTQHQGADQGMLYRNREGNEASSYNHFGSQSIGTSMYNMADAFHEMDPDETDSVDNSVTLVGPYRVKSDVAPILQAIIDKHGDIARDCQLRTVSMRSCVLEGLCLELQKLQSFTSTNLRSHHLKSLDSAISDAEHAELKVEWLRRLHNQLRGFMDLLQQYKNLKDDFTKSKEMVKSKKRTLDTKRADLRKIQSDIELFQSQLASSEAERENLDSSIPMSTYQSQCARFFGKSLAEGLL